MSSYKYVWKEDPKQKEYASETTLKKSFPEACEPDAHQWKTTFAFGVHDCKLCKARRLIK